MKRIDQVLSWLHRHPLVADPVCEPVPGDETLMHCHLLFRKEAPEGEPLPPTVDAPPRFSQRDPLWRSKRYTRQSSNTFGAYGCYVTALASLVAWAGYQVDPLVVALALDDAGAFTGGELMYPDKLAQSFTSLGEYGRFDWDKARADVGLLSAWLQFAPVVVKVDFWPGGSVQSHFVLAYQYEPDPEGGANDRLWVMDPWHGAYLDAAADVITDAAGKRSGGGYFWPEWWEDGDMRDTGKTRVERVVLGARVFLMNGDDS